MSRTVINRSFTDDEPVDPWDALLRELNRTVDMISRLDEKLDEATDDDELLPRGRLFHWVKWRDRERRHLVTVTRTVIQGGIAERLTAQAELDANAIVGVLERALLALAGDLTAEQELSLRSALGTELQALSTSEGAGNSSHGKVIDGESTG